jgi:hypothetical protein
MSRVTILTLVTATLWSAEAHAANPQGDLTFKVVPLQPVTCDRGSPAIVPAEAAAAGFTHCVANFDFSQPEYATLSNWFDCDGSNSNVLWHSGSPGRTFVTPCNINQKIDPAINQNVMNFEWSISDKSGVVGGQTFNNWTNFATLTVGNYYVETVNRVEGPACTSCPPNSGGADGDVYMSGPPEIIVEESNTIGFASAVCGGCRPSIYYWTNYGENSSRLPSGYSVFDYHTYGASLTSDGATNKYVCMWVDHILQNDSGCQIPETSNFNARSWLLTSAGSSSMQNIDFDVQYIRVWSCDAYQTSMCNGTTLATGANGLTYWH